MLNGKTITHIIYTHNDIDYSLCNYFKKIKRKAKHTILSVKRLTKECFFEPLHISAYATMLDIDYTFLLDQE